MKIKIICEMYEIIYMEREKEQEMENECECVRVSIRRVWSQLCNTGWS